MVMIERLDKIIIIVNLGLISALLSCKAHTLFYNSKLESLEGIISYFWLISLIITVGFYTLINILEYHNG